MRTRRLLTAVLSLLVVTACTGGESPDRPPIAETGGRIVVASGQDVTGKNGIRRQLIDAWNTKEGESGFQARLVELPGSADQQRSQLLGALQSGSSAYDVVNLDVTWVPEFAAAELIRPLPGSAVRSPGDIVRSVDDTSFWDGERYAVPFNSDAGLLYYRKDHLRAAGASRDDLGDGVTWPELRRLLDAVDRAKPQGYKGGWTTQLARYEGRTVNAIEAFASAVPGFRLTDDDGRYAATEEQLAAGVGELRERTASAYTLQEEALQSREAESLTTFTEGRTTFLRHWPYVYPALYETFGKNLGVTRLPGRTVLGGQNLAITSTTSDRRAEKAAELIAFLTDPDSERCLLRAGFAATRLSAYEEAGDAPDCTHAPAYAETPSASPTGESTVRMPPDQLGNGRTYSRHILLPALREAVQRPRTPLYGAVTQTLINQLDGLYDPQSADESPPSDAELARSLDQALRRELPD